MDDPRLDVGAAWPRRHSPQIEEGRVTAVEDTGWTRRRPVRPVQARNRRLRALGQCLFRCGLEPLRVARVDVVHVGEIVDSDAELQGWREPADDVARTP